MSLNQLRRMDVIDRWRQQAYLMSRTDRLGRVIMKSLDLMMTVVSDGLTSETLASEIQSLTSEREKTLLMDINANASTRSLLYGMSACLCELFDSIMERVQEIVEPSPTSSMEQVSGGSYGQDAMEDNYDFTDVKLEEDYDIKRETLISPVIIKHMNFLEVPKAPLQDGEDTSVIVKAEPGPGDLFVEKGRYVEPSECRVKTARWENQTQMFGPQFKPEIIKIEPSESVDNTPAKWVDYSSPNKIVLLPDSSTTTLFDNSTAPITTSTNALTTCAECGKDFDSSKGLHFHAEKRKEHIISPNDNPSLESSLPSLSSMPEFECRYCGKKCWTEDTLRLHQSMHPPIHCGICELTFGTPAGLAKHRREEHAHHLTCSKCFAKFNNSAHLKKHILEKTCESRIRQSRMLEAVLPQYRCDQCPASFQVDFVLSYHKRTVHGDKSFKCETRLGASNAGLQHNEEGAVPKNVVKSRGIDPFFCEQCSSSFSTYGCLVRHRQTIHREDPNECTICGSTFADRKDIAKHMRFMHREIYKRSI